MPSPAVPPVPDVTWKSRVQAPVPESILFLFNVFIVMMDGELYNCICV